MDPKILSIKHLFGLTKNLFCYSGSEAKYTKYKFPVLLKKLDLVVNTPHLFLFVLGLVLSLPIIFKKVKSYKEVWMSLLFFSLYIILLHPVGSGRYILIPTFLFFLLIISALYIECLEKQYIISQWILNIILVSLTFSALYFDLKTNPRLIAQKNIAEILDNEYKNATFYFFGWWKLPDIQLLSNSKFIVYRKNNLKLCHQKCYVIIDPLMKSLSKDYPKIKSFLEQKYKKVFSYEEYDLYKIR